jgi:GT2 family glycosyltransferase
LQTLDLSIIILAYKSKLDLERLLPSVAQSENLNFGQGNGKYSAEVIVVDNGSNDGLAENVSDFKLQIPTFKFIQNINNGFAKGNNLGIQNSSGRYILLLNPDTYVEKNTLSLMLDFMDMRPQVGISTCKVVLSNGKLDQACKRRFPNPWNALLRFSRLSNRDYNMLDTDEDMETEIDACMGAFMLVRREALDTFGLLDESFFMYGEDLDWCWRCKEKGFKVWYFPQVSITHFKGSSSKKVPFRALRWFHDAMWVFYRKHYCQKYPTVLNWLVFVGIYSRLFALTLLNLFKRNPKVS